MRALQGVKVSSTMTKSNPRPRKYASASDRQAAYRARAPEMCLRAESKTVDTLDRIAADLDISRADLLLSMTKFALANHDWARFGLTHKPLPFEYGIEKEKISTNPLPIWARPRPKNLGKSIPLTAAQKRKAKSLAAASGRKYPNLVDNIAASRNPTMKKPSPAQIAARKKFAEMARSGALNRKRQINRKANPAESGMRYQIFVSNGGLDSEYKTLAQMKSALDEIDRKPSGRYYGYDKVLGTTYRSFTYMTPNAMVKNNPRKKTVSQKISQLVHEGYPQKQSIAIALSEQRAGKVKKNPMEGALLRLHGNFYGQVKQYGNGLFTAIVMQKVKTGIGEEMDYYESKEFKTKAGAARFLANHGKTMANPASGRKGSQTQLNPVKYRDIAKGISSDEVTYSVHMPDRPSYQAMAYFTKKADALEVAQELSDRIKKPIAVSRVQVNFSKI